MILEILGDCITDPARTRNVVLFRMIFYSFDYCEIDLQPVRARRGEYL